MRNGAVQFAIEGLSGQFEIQRAFENSPQFTKGFLDYSVHFEAGDWWVAQDGVKGEVFVYPVVKSEVDGFVFEKV